MLGKLLKYEIKATGRIFLPLYLALLVLTIITKILIGVTIPSTGNFAVISEANMNIGLGLSMALYFTMIVALCVMTFIVIIQRFYKNLLTDEGYLMFTLPVKTWENIAAKLIIGIMWCVICGLILAISIFILAIGNTSTFEIFQSITILKNTFFTEFGVGPGKIIFEVSIGIFVNLIASILMIYVSIAIGQLVSKHRIMASIGAFIGLTFILQIIGAIIFACIPIMNLDALFNPLMNELQIIEMVINATTIGNIIFSIVFYLGTHYTLKNKLNLE